MTKPNWWQLPNVDTTQRTYADHMHSERLEYERQITAIERMCAWHVAMRQSLESANAELLHEIGVLWETAQFWEHSAALWRDRCELSKPTVRNIERKAAL